MLDGIKLSDKTYEDLFAEAVERIPALTGEWTNFNSSDPGITILQNLSAFTLAQRDSIDEVTDAVRLRLLALLGFEPEGCRAAEVYISPSGAGAGALRPLLELPPGAKLMAEDVCFEADGPVVLSDWGALRLLSETGAGIRDITYVGEGPGSVGAAVFGEPPQAGAAFYLLFERLPAELKELLLEVRVMNDEARNPFDGESLPVAQVRWEVFAKEGWEAVHAEDGTYGFLQSGRIRFALPAGACERTTLGGMAGYALRCVLEQEAYDVTPRVHSVRANLFRAVQKDTRVCRVVCPGRVEIVLRNRIARGGYIAVYGDEEGRGAYRAYTQAPPQPPDPASGRTERPGRHYITWEAEDGIHIRFDRKRFGYAPTRGGASVCVVCAEAESAEHLLLGQVMGYENQVIPLTSFHRILPESFLLLVCREDADGVGVYTFETPGGKGLGYRVLGNPDRIEITNPDGYEGATLYIAACAVTEGARGNIRAANAFLLAPLPGEEPAVLEGFTNMLPAEGGRAQDTIEALRRRFLADLRSPQVAVTVEDYEQIVRETPGLLIHKVRATAEPGSGVVRIAVKPYGEGEKPGLSGFYSDHIRQRLERYRLIGTQIEILPPAYVPIDVRASVYVRESKEAARREIEAWIKAALDGVNGEAPFGAQISYNALYHGIEALPCVEALYDFSITPQDAKHAQADGPDILLRADALSCAGEIRLEMM